MWNMKKCPRCGGDVYIDEDVDHCFEKCLQCGYERELQNAAVRMRAPKMKKRSPE